MKAGPLFLAGLAAAQPARHRRHQHRRDVVVEYVTELTYVTAANVIVYVDPNGRPFSTVYNDQPKPTPYAAPPAAALLAVSVSHTPSSYSATPKPSSSHAPSVSTTLVPKPASSTSTPAVQPSVPASGAASGNGITYSPYRTDSSCKSQDDVNADFQALFSKASYGIVRLYGTDCNQVAMVLKATAQKRTKLFLGIFDITTVEKQAQQIVDAVHGDWSRVDTVSVGNELVNNGQASVADIRSAVQRARASLTGYTGPVVTVDTFVAIIANPGLCDVGDYVAANCHAFFDGGVAAAGAGKFVQDQAKRVAAACGGKKTVITESGWPSKGTANKAAVPSLENQQAAVASLQQAFSSNLFLFSAFNEYWKPSNAQTFYAEQHWGIWGDSASCKAV